MTLFDMKGKVAVVTGATRGIGRAIAERMAEHGAKVVTSSRKQDVCDQVTKEVNDKFGKGTAVAIAANISSKENLQNLVDESNKAFGADPRGGPWVSVIRNFPDFAAEYPRLNLDHYKAIVAGMVRTLLARDTSPGAEPEDLLCLDIPTLIIPGADASHATSAARYLQECIPNSDYWDMPVPEQSAANCNAKVLDFLQAILR